RPRGRTSRVPQQAGFRQAAARGRPAPRLSASDRLGGGLAPPAGQRASEKVVVCSHRRSLKAATFGGETTERGSGQVNRHGLLPRGSENFQDSTVMIIGAEPTAVTSTPPAAISAAVLSRGSSGS